MNATPAPDLPVVVLLGNYPPDHQESMLRFRDLIHTGLQEQGYTVELIAPQGLLGRAGLSGGLGKWLGYVDKYVLFPPNLRSQLSAIRQKYPGRKIVVHICDHANAVYAGLARSKFPVLVTCHDLLAVRGALGEDTYCPASGFGKHLQSAILRGIGKATFVASVSHATQSDLLRLSDSSMADHSEVVPLTLNYPYRPLPLDEVTRILARTEIALNYGEFVLHVGSSAARKNREAVLKSVARIKDTWRGKIVFAGEPITHTEQALATSLGLDDRLCGLTRPDNETLLALYNAAHCLVFLSYAEGFGWPLMEAQASGCPIICSNRTSIPEVAGDGALVHEPDDYDGVGQDILRLQNPAFRAALVARGNKNAQAYSRDRMIGAYEALYRRI